MIPYDGLFATRFRAQAVPSAALHPRQELSLPPKITLEQAKGFSLFMLKAILNGRGDEIVELAETNLGR